ncbi:FAD:protein FMN transferase [Dinoroseobacter sp. S375]|uniref:FAD:protein FMN transferase n=1 Tax=Dinoroseobacter sp. S375 TaxID=3415136 RepID=UPI003C7EA92E
MTLSRRRFLTISAGALGLGAFGAAGARAGAGFTHWEGQALGAACKITLRAPPQRAQPALDAALADLRAVERLFNLYDPGSALSRLNAAGHLARPDPRFTELVDLADQMHDATEGRFDPSIQPLWSALARGGDARAARARVGWDRVRWQDGALRLAPGQALSFNGIAQGYATDLVSDTLSAHGFGDLLVNIGEFRGTGGPWRIGLQDPDQGLLGTRVLRSGAIATSSPRALHLARGATHILDPLGATGPQWSTVSVEAGTAAVADALSTALCLADRKAASRIKARVSGVERITLVDFEGDLVTL